MKIELISQVALKVQHAKFPAAFKSPVPPGDLRLVVSGGDAEESEPVCSSGPSSSSRLSIQGNKRLF